MHKTNSPFSKLHSIFFSLLYVGLLAKMQWQLLAFFWSLLHFSSYGSPGKKKKKRKIKNIKNKNMGSCVVKLHFCCFYLWKFSSPFILPAATCSFFSCRKRELSTAIRRFPYQYPFTPAEEIPTDLSSYLFRNWSIFIFSG